MPGGRLSFTVLMPWWYRPLARLVVSVAVCLVHLVPTANAQRAIACYDRRIQDWLFAKANPLLVKRKPHV